MVIGIYYADADGIILKGAHTIDGVEVYFDKSNGKQVKGQFVTESGYVGDKGFTTTTKILVPSSKVVTSLMVAIGTMRMNKEIFFQVSKP